MIRYIKGIMLLLALITAFGAVAMLPPDTFKDPIFASAESSGDEEGDDSGYTEFA